MSGTHKAVASVVPRSTNHQDRRTVLHQGRQGIRLWGRGGDMQSTWSVPNPAGRSLLKQMSHSGNGGSTAEPGQLHQLVHAEGVFIEELLINLLGLLLPAEQSVTC